MRNFIIADNQELTRFALESLLEKNEAANIYRAFDKAGLVALLKEHESAVVLLDYTLFDFTDEDQLLIISERFNLSDWILISDELTPQFIRRVVFSSHQFSVVFKDGPLSEVREALNSVERHTRYLSQRALETVIKQQQDETESKISRTLSGRFVIGPKQRLIRDRPLPDGDCPGNGDNGRIRIPERIAQRPGLNVQFPVQKGMHHRETE